MGAGENSVLSNYILPLEIEAGGTSTGPKGRFDDNVKAVEVLKEIEARGPAPTEEEKARIVSTAIAVALTAFIALAVRRKMEAALQRAVVHRRPPRGLIIHSDRGVQYACTAFAKWVNDHGFVQSMSRKGDCWDNAVAESFFHLLKTELTYHERWLDYQAAYVSPVRIHRDLLQPRKEPFYPGLRNASSIRATFNQTCRLSVSTFSGEYQSRPARGFGHIPPVEFEQLYYQHQGTQAMVA